MCVIADDTGPLGFGGIMGGEASGSTETTKNVLIECAYFDPLRTAATGRKAGSCRPMRAIASSAASIRPPCCPGLDLATDMILKFCGGKPIEGEGCRHRSRIESRVIAFDFGRVEKLTGVKLTTPKSNRSWKRSAS